MHGSKQASYSLRQDLGLPRHARVFRQYRPAIHRPASSPRGNHAPALRRAAQRGPPGASPGRHSGRGRPRYPHHARSLGRRGRPGSEAAAVAYAQEHCGVQRHLLRLRRPAPGYRARGGPRAGSDPAGHDHRLWRQPHLHPPPPPPPPRGHPPPPHGAFGAYAVGIGTSEVEHVLATQTLIQKRSRNMRIICKGELRPGVTAKDLVLAIIGQIGTAGATGHVIEFAGPAVRSLSMEGRMTMSNMAIEAGGRARLSRAGGTKKEWWEEGVA